MKEENETLAAGQDAEVKKDLSPGMTGVEDVENGLNASEPPAAAPSLGKPSDYEVQSYKAAVASNAYYKENAEYIATPPPAQHDYGATGSMLHGDYPLIQAAQSVAACLPRLPEQPPLADLVVSMRNSLSIENLFDGSDSEALLVTQARTLDALFHRSLLVATEGDAVTPPDVLIKTALRAQAQSFRSIQLMKKLRRQKTLDENAENRRQRQEIRAERKMLEQETNRLKKLHDKGRNW